MKTFWEAHGYDITLWRLFLKWQILPAWVQFSIQLAFERYAVGWNVQDWWKAERLGSQQPSTWERTGNRTQIFKQKPGDLGYSPCNSELHITSDCWVRQDKINLVLFFTFAGHVYHSPKQCVSLIRWFAFGAATNGGLLYVFPSLTDSQWMPGYLENLTSFPLTELSASKLAWLCKYLLSGRTLSGLN